MLRHGSLQLQVVPCGHILSAWPGCCKGWHRLCPTACHDAGVRARAGLLTSAFLCWVLSSLMVCSIISRKLQIPSSRLLAMAPSQPNPRLGRMCSISAEHSLKMAAVMRSGPYSPLLPGTSSTRTGFGFSTGSEPHVPRTANGLNMCRLRQVLHCKRTQKQKTQGSSTSDPM